MNKEHIFNKKAGISYLEIFIIVLSLFSFSYLIYSSTEIVEAQEEDQTVCCEETLTGQTCQDVIPSQCKQGVGKSLTKCEEGLTDFCKIGCCQSEKTGLCNVRSPQANCKILNGTFFEDPSCNVQECRMGCCILGDKPKWTTEKNCKFEGNTQNKDAITEWKLDATTNSELKCLFSLDRGKEGACVYNSGNERKCIYTNLDDCVKRTGSEINFDKNGTFCSDPRLNTTCKAKDHKGCIDLKEDVYWFDSCGNHEDVATDCSLARGSFCGKEKENFICKDINCVVDGVKRKNGESWCEYDGKIGIEKEKGIKDRYGRDPAGSRHIKHICYMGTERIAPCADFRNEICVQTDSGTREGTFSQASCRVNNWRMCYSYNNKKGDSMISTCEKNPDCFVKHIDMEGGFNFKVCLPQYPPGFNLNTDYALTEGGLEMPNTGEGICNIATQKCTETWICGIFGCFCVDSCKCHTSYFTEKMNEFCVSLGDCGAYINYVGSYTDGGYSLKSSGGAPPRGTSRFSQNAIKDPSQKADPGTFEFFETLSPESLQELPSDSENNESNYSDFEQELMRVSGAYGSPLLLRMLSQNLSDAELEESAAETENQPVNYGGFFSGVSSVRAGIESQIEYKERKAGGFEMIGAMIAGMIAYLITQSILITMMAAMMAYLFLMAWIIYVHITFTCDMWEVPTGGDDCNKCNSLEVPCTEYRCQSLGTLCQFVNKGTPNELCVSKPANNTLPTIKPLFTFITPGYNYSEVSEKGFVIRATNRSNECVEAYNTVRFGISVDPFAKCRFGIDPKQTYEEMPDKFGVKGNSILPAHRMDLFFPTPEAIKNRYNLTVEQMKTLGEIKLYVKCKTADGRINPEPYVIRTCIDPGPDRTAPRITYTEPFGKAYAKYNENTKDIAIYLNEPSDCRWSTEDQDYDGMNNSMQCNQDIHFMSMFGFRCNATISGINTNTKFFIRCRDISENQNKMSESFVFDISPSIEPLIIEEFRPENNQEIIDSKQPMSFDLRLLTVGGAEDGTSVCKWEANGGLFSDRFTTTNSSKHEYKITNARSGKYNVTFICEDAAGNIAINNSFFTVYVDEFGPKIVRVFNYGEVSISTDENSDECRYDSKRAFDFDKASLMARSSDGVEYRGLLKNQEYQIQCNDSYGNKGGKITIRPTA
ncbi:MAG: hypothetical protein WC867_02550 [Candidatus Pacearchaeota archaeon]|jgi:hypothetical protein